MPRGRRPESGSASPALVYGTPAGEFNEKEESEESTVHTAVCSVCNKVETLTTLTGVLNLPAHGDLSGWFYLLPF